MIADDSQLLRARTTLGDFELTVCTDGIYYLDGGAMFGVVPKPLWEKRAPADALNRIPLGCNTVIVRTGNKTVLIETGIGNKLDEKSRQIFENKQLLPQSLTAAGIKPEEIDIVINSHLHFDHCGWNTTKMADGSIVPTFPNAQYFAQRGEVEHGHLQLERDRVSYISENYDPLVNSGQMTLLDGNADICPGVSVYISDLIPTSAHLDITWVMGYDLFPLTCIEQRKRFYSRAIPEKWLVLFTHDHRIPMARIGLNDKQKPVLI